MSMAFTLDTTENIQTHPVLFDRIDPAEIHSAALHTFGAAGPSGLDARDWRRLCTSFSMASNSLCHSLSLLAKRLCTVLVDPHDLTPFTACRLTKILEYDLLGFVKLLDASSQKLSSML